MDHEVSDLERRYRTAQLTTVNEALRESEKKYRTLFDSIDEGFCTIEVLFDGNDNPIDYRFLEVNPSFEKQTGIQNAQGRRMREIAPQHEEHWFEIYGRIALTGEPVRFENQAAHLHRWYDAYAFRVGEPGDRKVAILFKDITERKQAEEELRRSEGFLAQGERIGHIGSWGWHVATGLVYWSKEHFRIFDYDPETTKPRRSILSLRSSAIEESGLTTTLQRLVEHSNVAGRLRCDFRSDNIPEESLPPRIQHELLRFAQEAISNAVRHARPTVVSVRLRWEPPNLILKVKDNGSGISSASLEKSEGFGLGNMRTRASQIDGKLDIQTAAGHGTSIVLTVPIPS